MRIGETRRKICVARITQEGREVARHEFGATDVIDPHDEVSMYWGWSFAWDGAPATLTKGAARISIELDKAAQAVRQVDCVLVTNDLAYVAQGRSKPDFAAIAFTYASGPARARPLLRSSKRRQRSTCRLRGRGKSGGPRLCDALEHRERFWQLYDKPPAERPLYAFNAEPIDEFVKAYAGKGDVPIFASKLIAPTVYINDLPELLKDGSAFPSLSR